MRLIESWSRTRDKRGVDFVAREVKIHADACRDEELIGDGVLIGVQVAIPGHSTLAERRVPSIGCKFVKNASSVCGYRAELETMPALAVRFVPGRIPMRIGVHVHKFDILKPAQDHPKHVIVGLIAQADCIFPKVKD